MDESSKEKNSKKIDIPIEKIFKKKADFKSHYVTGAIGGFKTQYDFRLSFYNIGINDFIMNLENAHLTEEFQKKDLEQNLKKFKMEHNLVCEVIMSEPAIRELYEFIGRQLKKRDILKEASKQKPEENQKNEDKI